jgi:YVTN family beta-propeller protein
MANSFADRSSFRHLWFALAFAPLALPLSAAAGGTARIYVTNSAGDSIHVVDPATNKVIQEIKGIEAAHGIAPSPDGTRVYVSNEADSTLDVFDRESGSLVKKVPLSNHPNNIAVTKNGDRILVQGLDPHQEHPGEGPAAQHLRDTRRQVPDHRLDPGQAHDRD